MTGSTLIHDICSSSSRGSDILEKGADPHIQMPFAVYESIQQGMIQQTLSRHYMDHFSDYRHVTVPYKITTHTKVKLNHCHV